MRNDDETKYSQTRNLFRRSMLYAARNLFVHTMNIVFRWWAVCCICILFSVIVPHLLAVRRQCVCSLPVGVSLSLCCVNTEWMTTKWPHISRLRWYDVSIQIILFNVIHLAKLPAVVATLRSCVHTHCPVKHISSKLCTSIFKNLEEKKINN